MPKRKTLPQDFTARAAVIAPQRQATPSRLKAKKGEPTAPEKKRLTVYLPATVLNKLWAVHAKTRAPQSAIVEKCLTTPVTVETFTP